MTVNASSRPDTARPSEHPLQHGEALRPRLRMPRATTIFVAAMFVGNLIAGFAAHAACRMVADAPSIKIAPAVQPALAEMQLSRPLVFDILKRTAIPETGGCWAGAAGNFDGQFVSAGSMQWNFGQGTLQFVLFEYRTSFANEPLFRSEIHRLMPRYGELIFSDGCRHAVLSQQCRSALLSHQHKGHLDSAFEQEFNALFESDAMIQIQFDRYLTTLTSVRSDIRRIFGDGRPTELRVKWALDTKTQQGSFPKDSDIKRYRAAAMRLTPAQRHAQLLHIIAWYDGICGTLMSDGTKLDAEYNVKVWTLKIDHLYASSNMSPHEPEIFDLLYLSFIRAIESEGQGGIYQALSFQRRATIILDQGSIGGRRW